MTENGPKVNLQPPDASPETPPTGGTATAATRRRVSGMKRVEEWKASEVEEELAKYTRREVAGTEAVCDPLVGLVVEERQGVLVKLLAEAGVMMLRYQGRRKVAMEALSRFFDDPAVNAVYQHRGRIINLPMAAHVVNAATSIGDGEEEAVSSSSASSSSSEPFEPSADAPTVQFLDNSLLLQQLETLMIESKNFGIVCAKVQEYLTLSIGALGAEDQDVLGIQSKLVDEFGAARDVAIDRYDFFQTYLDVRGGVERNMRLYPDVQSFRELLVARDASAWEEVARSWALLASSMATLSNVVSQNIKYVVAPDVDVHNTTESSLFM